MRNPIPHDRHLMIIGAMKSATSSLFRYLAGHPEICPSAVKEPEYFSRTQNHALQLAAYSDLWDFDPTTHRYALEASTGYTKFPREKGLPRTIYEYGLRPKFIFSVRDPIDRIVSHYNFMKSGPQEWSEEIVSDHLLSISRYYTQLEQFRAFFPKDDFLIVDFDDITTRPQIAIDQVCAFLEIGDWVPAEFSAENQWRLTSVVEKRLSKTPLGAVAGRLPKPVKRLAKRMLSFTPAIPRGTLTGDQRAYLHSQLQDDIARFGLEYDFDVAKWGFTR